ncbi:hypothetical protein JCM10908_000040 [Rhodotorula pacifica]|uniref:uncharacterized protein n=1 Tax=Rhodotorula pacifica TaxID=1495444 RepID=UPI0031819A2A
MEAQQHTDTPAAASTVPQPTSAEPAPLPSSSSSSSIAAPLVRQPVASTYTTQHSTLATAADESDPIAGDAAVPRGAAEGTNPPREGDHEAASEVGQSLNVDAARDDDGASGHASQDQDAMPSESSIPGGEMVAAGRRNQEETEEDAVETMPETDPSASAASAPPQDDAPSAQARSPPTAPPALASAFQPDPEPAPPSAAVAATADADVTMLDEAVANDTATPLTSIPAVEGSTSAALPPPAPPPHDPSSTSPSLPAAADAILPTSPPPLDPTAMISGNVRAPMPVPTASISTSTPSAIALPAHPAAAAEVSVPSLSASPQGIAQPNSPLVVGSTASQPAPSPSSSAVLPPSQPLNPTTVSPSPLVEPSPAAPVDPFSLPSSEPYRAIHSASKWNSLLGWARKVRLESSPGGAERGWDFGTGMYHVPRNSAAYTAGVKRLSDEPPLPSLSLHATAKPLIQNPDSANLSDEDDAAGGGGGGERLVTESGRPKRSRAAMTRG